jgi:hypothetical protein
MNKFVNTIKNKEIPSTPNLNEAKNDGNKYNE